MKMNRRPGNRGSREKRDAGEQPAKKREKREEEKRMEAEEKRGKEKKKKEEAQGRREGGRGTSPKQWQLEICHRFRARGGAKEV